jgi:uncharacterized protein (TIGR02453 family)
VEFFEGIEVDNTRAFWTAHKQVYEQHVRAPMAELLDELEPEFGPGRIHRPNRDIRFSADKSPYKTSISATLDRGGHVAFSARGLFVGSGMWMMTPEQLTAYRRAVADDSAGEALHGLVADLRRRRIDVGGHDTLKSAPKGYPKDHPRIELLRNKGLVAWKSWPAGAWLGRASAKGRIVEFLRVTQPLNVWLDRYVGSKAA